MLLAEKLASDPALAGHAFNFSNELEVSVLEIASRVLRVMGSRLELDVRNEAANEIPRQCLSAAKARRVLGWKPMFDLDDGMKRTVEWYRAFFAEAS
jgi:CDP-glucose 4,6-dehydratase